LVLFRVILSKSNISMTQRGDKKGGNSSAEEKDQLSNVLSDVLLKNADHQRSMNEISQYLEMQWMNDRNPDVQVARITPDQGDAASVELEGYSTVLASLEQLVADVSTMSNNIESRLERDTYSVQALTGRVSMLHARIRSISERKVRRSYDKSASTSAADSHHPGGVKGGKRHAPTSSSVAIHRPYEPNLMPVWSPAAVGTALCLDDKSNVFHRKALVSRLTTAEYYQNSTLDEEERQELQEEIAQAEEEIRRESELSDALEAMAALSIQQQQQQQQQGSAAATGASAGVVGVGGGSVASLLAAASPEDAAAVAAAAEDGGNKATDSSVGSKKGDVASIRGSVTKGGGRLVV
jgi:hypothetical protein